MMDLWDEVIEQIENDIEDRDVTALYEMLQRVPKDILIAYLPEEREFIVSDNQGLTYPAKVLYYIDTGAKSVDRQTLN